MKPYQVALKLRQIAATIDNSKNPRRELVASDLYQLISVLRVGATFKRETYDEVKNGIEDLAKKADDMGWESTAKKLGEAKQSLKEDLEAIYYSEESSTKHRIQI
jgi:hypothetical protein